MDLQVAFAAALIGYLLGAVSFARVIVALVAKGPVKPIELVTPDGAGSLVTDVVSASAVRLQLGSKWGLIVGLLDILKAFVPTLAFRLLFPGENYHLVVATASVIGHVWPVYYGFKGGVGQSPIVGGVMAISPVGALVTAVLGQVLGLFVFRDGLASDALHVPLLIPWMWIRFDGDPAYMLYALIANAVYFYAYGPVIRQYLQLRRDGHLPTPEHSIVMFEMDFPFMRRLAPDRYAEVDALIASREARS